MKELWLKVGSRVGDDGEYKTEIMTDKHTRHSAVLMAACIWTHMATYGYLPHADMWNFLACASK